MKRNYWLVVLILIMFFLPNAHAAQKKTQSQTAAQTTAPKTQTSRDEKMSEYWDKISPKIDFGAANFLMGWTELLTEPVDHYNAANRQKFLHGTLGLGEGLVNGVLDTVGGLLNLATGFVPGKIPLPKNGVDVNRLAQPGTAA